MTTRKFKQTKGTNYFSIISIALLFGVFITSCKEEFDEELLISQQQRADDIAAQEADAEAAQEAANAAALAASQLLDYTLTLHSDDVPAEGVVVNLTNNAGTTASVTTDADGNAVFTGLAMGGHTVSISSSDFLDASYNVDFGTPVSGIHYEIIDGKVYSLGTNAESSKVELYNLSAMQMATITGKVEIETDLTNDNPEVPQDITIRANLDGLTPANSHSFIDEANQNTTSIYVSGSFTFTEGDIGVATVDNTTGEYTMQVPATDDGVDIELLFPLVEAEQTLGWAFENGEYVGPQVGPKAAVFGPDITAAATPSIKGVDAEFTAPPEPGRGFDVTSFTAAERGLGGSAVSIDNFPVESDLSEIRFRGSQGSGYLLTPQVTVSNPDLSGPTSRAATVEAWMDWTFESVSYTAQPAATYGANQPLLVSVNILDEGGVRDSYGFARINAEADGSLVAATVDLDPNINIFNDPVPNPLVTEYVVTGFTVSISGPGNPTGTLTRSGSVDVFRIPQGGAGRGYTDIPTIDVEAAPAGGINATLEITDMAFQYYFDLDNTGVTQPYVVLPDVSFEYTTTPAGSTEVFTVVNIALLNDDGFLIATFFNPFPDLKTTLTVSGNQLLFNETYFGSFEVSAGVLPVFSYTIPRAIVVEPTHSQTTADIDVNADGEITGLSNITHGKGYNTTYDVQFTTLDGLPGSGAVLDLVDFDTDVRTGEVTWGQDYIVLDGGSDYTLDVNIPEEPFTPATASQVITVKNGETKIINVNYGTGKPVAELE